MVDNVSITPGTGVTIAADDIGSGFLAQRVKPVWGPDGTGNDVDVATGKPMPVQLRASTGQTLSDATGVLISTAQLTTLATTAQAMSVGFQLVGLPTDQPVPNKVQAQSSGTSASRVVASASSNTATNLKASAGNIFEIDVFNVAAYDVFLKLYNKASAPTVGTDTPVFTIPLKAGTGYSKSFLYGRNFATGIAYGITKLQADSDTTALAAGDVTGSIGWI
jgi:hypothetical protein